MSYQHLGLRSKSFTLIELLITIGIIAILSTLLLTVLNPWEMIARSRDTKRITELRELAQNISLLIAQDFTGNISLGNPNTVYVSLPSDQPDCSDLHLPALPAPWIYHCSNSNNFRKVDSSGWLPINFQEGGAIQLSALPLDPQNTYTQNLTNRDDLFFTYAVGADLEFELNAKTESIKYGFKDRDMFPIINPATYDNPLSDGGDNGLYETGSLLTLIPDSGGLCPSGMVYVPAPLRICLDRYEVSYSNSGTKPDGTYCNARCPLSIPNANPWTSRSGWPSVPQDDGVRETGASADDALDYCANMGKVLPTDFEWYLGAAGTPDPYNSKPSRIIGSNVEGPEPCMIWNTDSTDNLVERPQGSTQCDDGYTWGSDINPNIKTGTALQCISLVGAYDMIGNVWEWVNDTKNTNDIYSSGNTKVPNSNRTIAQINNYGVPVDAGGTSCSGLCNSDYYWVTSGSLTAGLRSGSWFDCASAGRFCLNLFSAPSNSYYNIGFRCALR